MSIHVCRCERHGVEEFHLRYPGMKEESAQRIADEINGGALDHFVDANKKIAALEAQLAAEREKIARLEGRMCLVCGRPEPCQDAPDACTFDPDPISAAREFLDRARMADEELAAVRAERDALLSKIALAYGHLWHVNEEPFAPVPVYTPQKAAWEARKILRDTLTSEQRGDGINATQKVWGDAAIDKAREGK